MARRDQKAHPLIRDVLQLVDPKLATGVAAVTAIRGKFAALGARAAHGTNLLALAASVLASAHELKEGSQPLAGAQELVDYIHSRTQRRDEVLPEVVELLGEVRDQIAIDGGRRRDFVLRVRGVLQAVEALAPDVLDVQHKVLLIGGRRLPIGYTSRTGESLTRFASVANREGRVLLMCATGRGPRRSALDTVLLHRVRKGLERASGLDPRCLTGDPLRLEPAPRLTERARAAASRIRTVSTRGQFAAALHAGAELGEMQGRTSSD